MSQLDFHDGFAGIRDQFLDNARLSTLDTLAARGTARRRRRWAARATGAVAAVVALVALVTALPALLRPPLERQPLRPAPLPAVLLDLPSSGRTTRSFVIDAKTLLAELADRPRSWVYTDDGGRTWSAWELPGTYAPVKGQEIILRVDARTLIIDNLISHDKGHSWAVRPSGAAAVNRIEPGWPLVDTQEPRGSVGPVGVIDPANGSFHRLASAPPSCRVPMEPQPTDGSYWLTCYTGVAVSRDHGASWQQTDLLPRGSVDPNSDMPQGGVKVTTFDGRVAYAQAQPIAGGGATLYASTDGGRHWQKVQAFPAAFPMMEVLPDNSLTRAGLTGQVERSTDGGRTFALMDIRNGAELAPALRRTPGGAYLVPGFVQTCAQLVSSDGFHYAKVVFPPGFLGC